MKHELLIYDWLKGQPYMKALILHPDFGDSGGVAAYYRKLKDKFSMPVEHFIIGKRPAETGRLRQAFRMLFDYMRFVNVIRRDQVDIVHLNPSLDLKSIVRDGIFLLLGKVFKTKTIMFIHGWDEELAEDIDRYGRWLYKKIFNLNSAVIVLAEEFKARLERWGFTAPIYRECTVADDKEFEALDFDKITSARMKSEKFSVLFISRILKEKGIYETIEAVSILQPALPNLELIIAGDGAELEAARAFVSERQIPNVVFAGYVKAEEKNKLFEKVQILCFPTYYGEGLPVVIIESMAFGLPIITRPVGGVADFFIDGQHGFLTTSRKPSDFAQMIKKLYRDRNLYRQISLFNYTYAKDNFMASNAARRWEALYTSILNGRDSASAQLNTN